MLTFPCVITEEEVGVVVPRFPPLLQRGRGLAVDVPEVHLLVQKAKHVVVTYLAMASTEGHALALK